MKEIKNITLYKCDFCGKELKRKHAMENHEVKCNSNPLNKRPCLDFCKHLERRNVVLGIGRENYMSNGEEVTKTYNGFFCNLKQQYLVHPKAEHINPYIKSEVTYDESDNEIRQESMPKNCNEYKVGF